MSNSEGLTKDKYTIAEHRFKTEDGLHELYVQEWGNPKGTPILFLHGGPGACCRDKHKDNYDAKKHYVIFFDQRGAGNSKPKGSIEQNTTQKLIEDIELIKKKLNLDKFSIHGGSWGSTLALSYAVDHPDSVTSLLLSGIFLGTKEECDWFEKVGYKDFFPEVWEFITDGVPKEHMDNPGAYHRQQIQDKGSKESAYKYTEGEGNILSLDHRFKLSDYEDYDISYAKIISHYIGNNCFLPKNHIINNAKKLTMPVYIIHGRYDMVCLPKSAYQLHKALPNSKIFWTLAGHSGSDRSNYEIRNTLMDLAY